MLLLVEITRRRELLAAGYTPSEVRRFLRDGRLASVRRGGYTLGVPPSEPELRHLVQVRAAVPDLAPDAVISHVSAALLHGMDVWGIPLRSVGATRSRRSGARRGAGVHLRAAPLDPDEITSVGGIRVTTPARTVVDVARSVPFEQAVAVADSALHKRLVTPAELDAALARCAGRPGSPAARRAIAFADGRSESVGESRSRVAMTPAGLPAPVLQWEVVTRSGPALGRVDFAWPRFRVVVDVARRVPLRRGGDPPPPHPALRS
jgi:predicted transcriptional regulator of viral defense system